MSAQGLFGLLPKLIVVSRIIKGLAAGVLGLAALGWIIEQASPRGEVVVHVTEPDVEVIVGGRTYRIGARVYDPIVCQLPMASTTWS